MILIDTNLLIYAYHADTPKHSEATRWLTDLLNSSQSVALPWVVLWGFVRVSSNARVWPRPMTVQDALRIVDELSSLSNVFLLQPGPRHVSILGRLLTHHNISGPAVTDAVLAALAIESNATLASTDRDFRRFEGLRYVHPLA